MSLHTHHTQGRGGRVSPKGPETPLGTPGPRHKVWETDSGFDFFSQYDPH